MANDCCYQPTNCTYIISQARIMNRDMHIIICPFLIFVSLFDCHQQVTAEPVMRFADSTSENVNDVMQQRPNAIAAPHMPNVTDFRLDRLRMRPEGQCLPVFDISESM